MTSSIHGKTPRKLGINPFQNRINEIIRQNELEDRLEKNKELLSFATPKIEKLSDVFNESKTMFSIADHQGTILNSVGERNVLKQAETINIFTGELGRSNRQEQTLLDLR